MSMSLFFVHYLFFYEIKMALTKFKAGARLILKFISKAIKRQKNKTKKKKKHQKKPKKTTHLNETTVKISLPSFWKKKASKGKNLLQL